MAIKIGNTNISKLYLGTTGIAKVYVGDTQIFPSSMCSVDYTVDKYLKTKSNNVYDKPQYISISSNSSICIEFDTSIAVNSTNTTTNEVILGFTPLFSSYSMSYTLYNSDKTTIIKSENLASNFYYQETVTYNSTNTKRYLVLTNTSNNTQQVYIYLICKHDPFNAEYFPFDLGDKVNSIYSIPLTEENIYGKFNYKNAYGIYLPCEIPNNYEIVIQNKNNFDILIKVYDQYNNNLINSQIIPRYNYAHVYHGSGSYVNLYITNSSNSTNTVGYFSIYRD